MAVGSLGSILPELILLIGGLVILLLDTAFSSEEDSGRGFMAVAILFLVVALVGVVLQFGMEPHTALTVIDVDPIAGGTYMNRRTRGRGEFWTLFMFVTLAMSVAVSANNLLLIFLGIEFLSITSYILVGFVREDNRSSEAGVKYFLYGSVASAIMLYGISLFYGASGSLNLREIGQTLANVPDLGMAVMPAAMLTLVGLGFKASLAPFFQWAPDTYDGAPTPITAYLSTASKAVGFAVMARIFLQALWNYQIDWVPILAGLSVLTMSVGNLMALRQNNVKRMLAYSSVAQAGYMLMGLTAVVASTQADVTTLGMNGLNGLLLYLFAYLFTNIGAFMVVQSIEEFAGSTELSAFENLGRRAPALAWAMFIFLLSLTGIPLTGGFVGKFYVFGATVQHRYFWLAAIALINAGIAAYYYLNVVRAMFFPAGEAEQRTDRVLVTPSVQLVLFLCVLATFWIGLYPPNVIEWANTASQYLLTVF